MKLLMWKKKISWSLIVAMIALNGSIFNQSSTIFADEIKDLKENQYEKNVVSDLSQISVSLNDKIFGGNGGSDTLGNNRVISSTFEFASLNIDGREGKSHFYYTDDFFKNPSTTYNNHLSTTSIELAISGVANNMEDPKDKYGNLKDFMSKMGFKNITPSDDYLRVPENNTMGSVCANKPIYVKNSAGAVEKYNLMVIAMRSANYQKEWELNFKVGETGDHEGFSYSRDRVYSHVESFYNSHKDDFGAGLPIKLWVVGYSRGAAVANMLGGKLTDNAGSFNTTMENIYCYTLGTPRGVLISAHANSLDSYTNIHNVVSEADILQSVLPITVGFGRYGVDHEVPYLLSEKVHDASERANRMNNNRQYLAKYNEMINYFENIDPPSGLNINDFHVYKLILVDSSLNLMKYTDLSEEPFTDTSEETSYYQSREFYGTLMKDVIGDELLNCAYPGIDYATMTGRERIYTKYQDLLVWIVRNFLATNNSATIVAKIQENVKTNLGMAEMFLTMQILFNLVYTDTLHDSNACDYPDVAGGPNVDAYEILHGVYEKLLDGAVSTEDYNFLMSKHRDITDFILDLLNVDYRTNHLTKQTVLGSISKNISSGVKFHMQDTYLAWLMIEDDYYKNPPADTVYIYGNKTVAFTQLNNTIVKIYDEQDNYIGEYKIDNNNNVECTNGLDSGFVNITKAYNPEGMELRIPSSLNYKAVVIATNSSIGNVVYKEYFIDDSSFFRKVKNLGTVYLNEGERYVIEFKQSHSQDVFSCYPYELASDIKRKSMKVATINEVLCVYGNDSYSYTSEPLAYKINDTSLYGMSVATASTVDLLTSNESALATPSDTAYDNIATASDLTDDNIDYVETDIATSSDADENVNETNNLNETGNANETINVTETESASETNSTTEIESTNADNSNDIESTTETESVDETNSASESDSSSEVDSETETMDISEQTETVETSEVIETNETSEAIDTSIANEADEESEKEESNEIIEPEATNENVSDTEETEAESDGEITGFTGTDALLGTGDTYVVNFDAGGFASLYYYNGTNYVKTTGGNSFATGTKIKVVAPRKPSNYEFYGWTLKNGAGDILNKRGVDTPKIEDFSSGNESIYVIELMSYDIDIKANYVENYVPIEPDDKRSHHSSGSSGSSGSGIIPTIQEQIFKTNVPDGTLANKAKSINATYDTNMVNWHYDPLVNKWKLGTTNSNGQTAFLSNGFYEIISYKTTYVNDIPLQEVSKDVYYIDSNENMVTGFVITADNNRYFFETAKTINEGKMVLGWKNIGGFWYYFNIDGSMAVNTITEDGYMIGFDGRWIQN